MLLAGFVTLRQVKDSQRFKCLVHLTPQHLTLATASGFRGRGDGTVVWLEASWNFSYLCWGGRKNNNGDRICVLCICSYDLAKKKCISILYIVSSNGREQLSHYLHRCSTIVTVSLESSLCCKEESLPKSLFIIFPVIFKKKWCISTKFSFHCKGK